MCTVFHVTRYKGVHIPVEIYKRAQPLMEPFGYRSFAELVCQALREKIRELEAIQGEKNGTETV